MSNDTPVTKISAARLNELATLAENDAAGIIKYGVHGGSSPSWTQWRDLGCALRELQSLRASAAKAKADATYGCSACEWGGELPKFVNTTDNSYRVVCPKCGAQAEINTDEPHERLTTVTADCAPSPEQQGAEQPIAYLHRIVEPDVGQAGGLDHTLFTYSPENPWSHWVAKHREKCTWTCTPLYSTAPAPALGLTQDERALLDRAAYRCRQSANECMKIAERCETIWMRPEFEKAGEEDKKAEALLRSLLERGGA
jgi:hypothetical protein